VSARIVLLFFFLASHEALGALSICGRILLSARLDAADEVVDGLNRAFLSPGGRWASVPSRNDGQADLVELPTGRVLSNLEIQGHRIRNLIFGRSGNHLLAYDGDRTVAAAFLVPEGIHLWTWFVPAFGLHVRPYLSTSPDSTLLLVPRMNSVDVLRNGAVIASLKDLPIVQRGGVIAADNRTLILFTKTGAPEVYAIEEGSLRLIRTFTLSGNNHSFDIRSGHLDSNGRFFALAENSASTYGSRVRTWNVNTGNIYQAFQFRESRVRALSISPDGGLLAVAESHSVRLINLGRREVIANLTGTFDEDAFMRDVVFSADGTRVLASLDNSAEIWEWDISSALSSTSGSDNTTHD